LKRWITVTAPVFSTPGMPRQRARRRNDVETAAMSSRNTTVVKAGSKASFALSR
jgi:hypothetical protein